MIYKRTQTTKQNQKNDAWTKWEYYELETIRKQETEILELKNVTIGLKKITTGVQ